MILFIDTTRGTEIEIALYEASGVQYAVKLIPVHRRESEELLPAINDILENNAKKVSGIIVMNGRDSRFSATRSGVAAANALGFAWGVSVMGILKNGDFGSAVKTLSAKPEFDKPVIPIYSKEPNGK